MSKFILAALILANLITIAGIARADSVGVCSVDAKGNLSACVSRPLSMTPAKPHDVLVSR